MSSGNVFASRLPGPGTAATGTSGPIASQPGRAPRRAARARSQVETGDRPRRRVPVRDHAGLVDQEDAAVDVLEDARMTLEVEPLLRDVSAEPAQLIGSLSSDATK